MGINSFPAALVPIIQTGMLAREFEDALRSKLGYRMIADREAFPNRIGETITKTRAGLKASKTTPMTASANTNLDNGLSPSSFGVEQYTLSINMYGDSIDLNMVTDRVGIASQFVQNAKVNGEQAARSLDELARNALFTPYFGGNTRVRTTLGSAGTTVAVDDVRGFQTVYVNGVATAVSSGNPMTVLVNGDSYTLNSVTVDGTSVSTAPNGVSGSLVFSANVTTADATAGNTVTASTASAIVRPNSRANTSLLTSADTLTMDTILNGVATLRLNAIPTLAGDIYHCYLDPMSARQLFSDANFRQLFQGVGLAAPFLKGELVSPFLGVRFLPTTEAYTQSASWISSTALVRRPIICGAGALIEGDFAGMASEDVAPADSIIDMVDGVVMVTREPLDRLQQIIAQSWYWIGGYCAPSDTTTSPTTVPTATNANFKRCVLVEHVG